MATPILRIRPPLRIKIGRLGLNKLSLTEIMEMAGKGVSEPTMLNVLCASRVISTITTKAVTELQEAKVSRLIIAYLLSTPLLYKGQPDPF